MKQNWEDAKVRAIALAAELGICKTDRDTWRLALWAVALYYPLGSPGRYAVSRWAIVAAACYWSPTSPLRLDWENPRLARFAAAHRDRVGCHPRDGGLDTDWWAILARKIEAAIAEQDAGPVPVGANPNHRLAACLTDAAHSGLLRDRGLVLSDLDLSEAVTGWFGKIPPVTS